MIDNKVTQNKFENLISNLIAAKDNWKMVRMDVLVLKEEIKMLNYTLSN